MKTSVRSLSARLNKVLAVALNCLLDPLNGLWPVLRYVPPRCWVYAQVEQQLGSLYPMVAVTVPSGLLLRAQRLLQF